MLIKHLVVRRTRRCVFTPMQTKQGLPREPLSSLEPRAVLLRYFLPPPVPSTPSRLLITHCCAIDRMLFVIQ